MSARSSAVSALAVGLALSLLVASPSRAEPGLDQAAVARAHAEFAQGQTAYRAGDLKQALAHFQNAYALVPSAELEFDLARIYERLGEADRAIKIFRAYVRRAEIGAEERTQIEVRIGELIALRARQRAQVIEAPPARAALTAEARAFFERGAKLFRRGRYRGALAAFSAAQGFAHLPELSYNLAVTSERLERWDDAIAFYRTYLREAKDSADAEAVEARIRAIASNARASASSSNTPATDRSPRRPAR